MALRNIVTKEDKILCKVCRPVVKFNERLHQLLDDMADTLADAGGVGLAAPQVGVLRRAVLVLETNVEEDDEEFVIELINPEIIETSGEQVGAEGCLSVPGEYGIVRRPEHVKVKAAGGIASLADAEDFIALGAERLGTSRIVKLAMQLESESGAPDESY